MHRYVLLGLFKPADVDIVGEVADEALGFHAERFTDDLGVHNGDEADDPCRAQPFGGGARGVEDVDT